MKPESRIPQSTWSQTTRTWSLLHCVHDHGSLRYGLKIGQVNILEVPQGKLRNIPLKSSKWTLWGPGSEETNSLVLYEHQLPTQSKDHQWRHIQKSPDNIFSENDENREFVPQSSSTLTADISRTKTNFSKIPSKPFSGLQSLAIEVNLSRRFSWPLKLSSTWIKEIRHNKAEKSENKNEQQQLPDSLVTEWQEFFAPSVYKSMFNTFKVLNGEFIQLQLGYYAVIWTAAVQYMIYLARESRYCAKRKAGFRRGDLSGWFFWIHDISLYELKAFRHEWASLDRIANKSHSVIVA